MKQNRRSFIRTGGITLAVSGIVPFYLQSCKTASSPEGTADPLLYDMTGDVEPLEDMDYVSRQSNVRKLMAEAGVDALLIEGGVNMQYFFDVSWWSSERVFCVILPAKGKPVWVCPTFELSRASESIRFGTDIRTWQEHESPYRLIGDVFNLFSASSVAVDPNARSFVVQGIRKESRAELVDASFLINPCRAIKTGKELRFMDLANTITKRAYKWAFEQVESGMMPSELESLISSGHQRFGTTGNGWPLFGKNSAYPHGTSNVSELRDGDLILVDGGCTIEGYRSDVTRSIVFGTPTERQRRVFEIVKRAQDAVHAAVRPGISAGELDRIARTIMEDEEFGPGYDYFVHRLGHGIGLDWHEWPYLVKDNPVLLEPGMTLSNEPGIYIYGEFGIRIEDCFVVTEDGGEFLGGMLCHSLDEPFGQ